jgi:hypothetical protein
MLAMSKLDTYKSIEHYAKNPHSPENILSLRLLRRRTELDSIWKSFAVATDAESLEGLLNLYLGIKDTATNDHSDTKSAELTAPMLMSMSREQQIEVYTKLCASAGYNIDPSTLLDKRGKDATKSI